MLPLLLCTLFVITLEGSDAREQFSNTSIEQTNTMLSACSAQNHDDSVFRDFEKDGERGTSAYKCDDWSTDTETFLPNFVDVSSFDQCMDLSRCALNLSEASVHTRGSMYWNACQSNANAPWASNQNSMITSTHYSTSV